jgi:hypothetical protein
MPVESDSERLSLRGHCTVEEAESVLEWILQHPQGEIDLSELEHMHMSIFQILLAAGAPRLRLPRDPFWQQLWRGAAATEGDSHENCTRGR